MKMMKKMLPKESVSYYSKIGNRIEVDINGTIMGKDIVSSTIMIQNYIDSIMSIYITATINDSIINNSIKNISIPISPISTISFYDQHKEILGYNCVYFTSENDSTKIEGFLTKEISGVGEFKNVGMPLEYRTIHKKDKYTSNTQAKKILLESFDENQFIIYD